MKLEAPLAGKTANRPDHHRGTTVEAKHALVRASGLSSTAMLHCTAHAAQRTPEINRLDATVPA